MSPQPETSSQSGMSRAAKKRAKKKKKEAFQSSKRNPEERADDDAHAEAAPPPKKKRPEGQPKIAKEECSGDKMEDLEMDDKDRLTIPGHVTLKQLLLLEEVDDEELQECLEELTSQERARCALQVILGSVSVETFYETYWEKKPLLVKSGTNPTRLDGFLSLKRIRTMLEHHPFFYSRDLNVCRYTDDASAGGKKRRVTLDHKTEEPVQPKTIWKYFHKENCTIRLLCPHKHNDDIHALLSLLELEWGCMVGANAYLTPPRESQGFAPHYDDIEAFVLQLEGTKRWKVYPPTLKLPRASSEDFVDEDLKDPPVLDAVLHPGDVLYMPRGWIHQACTEPSDKHALHLTVSAYQQWAWVDFLETLMPAAMETVANNERSTSLREGLPINFLDYMGAIHEQEDETADDGSPGGNDQMDTPGLKSDEKKLFQEEFRIEANKRIMRVAKEAMDMVSDACDEMGRRFLIDRLPPALTKRELAHTNESDGKGQIWPNTLCRLARPGIARLVAEDGKAVLYHCGENSRVYHENPISPMEFDFDDAPALEQLLTTVEPHWICTKDLIHESIEDKIQIVQSLYNEGILAIWQATDPST